MDKLICVEYAPAAEPSFRTERGDPLKGLIGETLEKYLGKRHDQDKIPVRFPLVGPGSHVSLIRNDRVPNDPYQVFLEGVMTKRSSLYVLPKVTPVTLYTRIPMGDPKHLFGKSLYSSTYGLRNFTDKLTQLQNLYPLSWVWKLEKKLHPEAGKHIFVEARFYGIDTVINTYAANKLEGIAMQIIYKPQPTKEMKEKGIQVMRTCSDLYLLSNSHEYVSYLDGTEINRERMDYQRIMHRHVTGFVSPKDVTSSGRFREYHKSILEGSNQGRGSKKEEKVKTVLGDVPPPKKSKKRLDSFVLESTDI